MEILIITNEKPAHRDNTLVLSAETLVLSAENALPTTTVTEWTEPLIPNSKGYLSEVLFLPDWISEPVLKAGWVYYMRGAGIACCYQQKTKSFSSMATISYSCFFILGEWYKLSSLDVLVYCQMPRSTNLCWPLSTSLVNFKTTEICLQGHLNFMTTPILSIHVPQSSHLRTSLAYV